MEDNDLQVVAARVKSQRGGLILPEEVDTDAIPVRVSPVSPRACHQFGTATSVGAGPPEETAAYSDNTPNSDIPIVICGSFTTCSFSTCTSRDLPIPASPVNRITCPCPSLAYSQRSRSMVTSDSRPTSGVEPRVEATSSRLCGTTFTGGCDTRRRVQKHLEERALPIPDTRSSLG